MARVRSTFAGRLIAAVFLLVLLPTVLLGAFVYTQSRSNAMDEANGPDRSSRRRTSRTASTPSSSTNATWRGMRLPAVRCATSSGRRMIQRRPTRSTDWLASGPFVVGNDHVEDIFVLDAQGTCIASTEPGLRRRVLRHPALLPAGGRGVRTPSATGASGSPPERRASSLPRRSAASTTRWPASWWSSSRPPRSTTSSPRRCESGTRARALQRRRRPALRIRLRPALPDRSMR